MKRNSAHILEAFASRPLAFRCRPQSLPRVIARNPFFSSLLETQPPRKSRFVVSVEHRLGDPASPAALKRLQAALGNQSVEFHRLYARHNGFSLYKDPRSDVVGVEVLPISGWRGLTRDMQRVVRSWTMPDRHNVFFGVAFACVPRSSANFFAMPVSGRSAGRIFYVHDGMAVRFAASLDGFVRRITRNPLKLLVHDLGGRARYSDDTGFRFWVPAALVAGTSLTSSRLR
jgi:hypothetical protein